MLEEEKIKELKEELKKLNEHRNSIISTIEDLQKEVALNRFKGKYFKVVTEYQDIYYISVSNTGKFFEFIFYNRENYHLGFDFVEKEYKNSLLCNCSSKIIKDLTKEEYRKDLLEAISKYTDLIEQKAYKRIS